MSIVCGKRSFFEDVESAVSSPAPASPPLYKKFRCSSSTSPVRFTCSPSVYQGPLDQLKALFPDMEIQVSVAIFFLCSYFLCCFHAGVEFLFLFSVFWCITNHGETFVVNSVDFLHWIYDFGIWLS